MTKKKINKEIKEEIVKNEVVVSAEQKKREKKVYDLPGQKRDPPEEVCIAHSCFHVSALFEVFTP